MLRGRDWGVGKSVVVDGQIVPSLHTYLTHRAKEYVNPLCFRWISTSVSISSSGFYNDVRQSYELSRVESFREFGEMGDVLEEVYGDVDRIEAYVGANLGERGVWEILTDLVN